MNGLSISDVVFRMKPLGRDILVIRHPSQAKTEEGVIIPEHARTKTSKGLVLRTSEGFVPEGGDGMPQPIPVKVLDEVLLSEYCGTILEVEWPEEVPDEERGDVMVMDFSEPLAVLRSGRPYTDHPGLARILQMNTSGSQEPCPCPCTDPSQPPSQSSTPDNLCTP